MNTFSRKSFAPRGKVQRIFNRRFSPIIADKDSDISPQRRRARRELNFCLSGDDDKQKQISLEALRFCPIVVSRLGKNSYLSVLGVLARYALQPKISNILGKVL
jgi:hypothetical protein